MKKYLDFKDKLILMYFNNLSEAYNPVDIIQLLKIPYEHMHERITKLKKANFLLESDYLLKISDKGRDYLELNYLSSVKLNIHAPIISDVIESYEISNKDDVIFIPKDFQNKVK
ncbi:hypothetical protein ACMX2M_20725 [Paenibacillus polymyxa]